jgi:hypothetical protein
MPSFSLDGGKLPGLAFHNSSRKIGCLLHHPERTAVDVRLLSQIELNIIRTEAYAKIMCRDSDFLLQHSEDQLRSCHGLSLSFLNMWWCLTLGEMILPVLH